MDKRKFIKTGLIGVAGLVSVPSIARSLQGSSHSLTSFELPIKSDGFLSNPNLESHFKIFNKASGALSNSLSYGFTKAGSVKDILLNSQEFDSEMVHYANSYLNHKIFFKSFLPAGNKFPDKSFMNAIENNFGSFENMKFRFKETALANSNTECWVWLIAKNNSLYITSTPEDYNPFSTKLPDDKRGYPLMGIDMWEHAYYLDYQKNTDHYVHAFLNNINWNFVSKRYSRALQSKI